MTRCFTSPTAKPFLLSHVLPMRTMRKLIERGVRDHTGKKSVEYQIYRSEGQTLEETLNDMRGGEIRIAKDRGRAFSAGLFRGARRRYKRFHARREAD